MRGKIVVEHTVFCAACSEWQYLDTHTSTPAKAARELGFKQVPGRGWLCPLCLKRENISPPNVSPAPAPDIPLVAIDDLRTQLKPQH